MIRLSQARAKACLRDFVLEEDALDVVELITQSVAQVHTDEKGSLDLSRGGAGGKSNRKSKKAFVNELYRIVGPGNECQMEDLRRIASKVNCELHDFASLVESMRDQGTIMKTGTGSYRVAT
jgi:DNA helicase MCM8